MARPFQFGLSDILLLTAIVAALVATIASRQATIAFITQGILLMFVWHRPVVLRLWVTGTIGLVSRGGLLGPVAGSELSGVAGQQSNLCASIFRGPVASDRRLDF